MAKHLTLYNINTNLNIDGISIDLTYSWNYSNTDDDDYASGSYEITNLPLDTASTIWEDFKSAALAKFITDFTNNLSGSDPTLDDILLVPHDTRQLSNVKIADYAGIDFNDHRTLNYKTELISGLHKEITTMYRGEVRKVDYYDGPAKAIPVLTVDIDYVRQPNGLLTMVNPNAVWGDADFFGRRTTRTWYKKDGSLHPLTKTRDKVYDAVSAMSEGERRRKNVIQDLSINLLTMLAVTETAADPANPTAAEITEAEVLGVSYISKYESAINIYYTAGSLSWTGKAEHQSTGDAADAPTPNISDDTEAWLSNDLTALGMPGTTIKDYLLNTLKFIYE